MKRLTKTARGDSNTVRKEKTHQDSERGLKYNQKWKESYSWCPGAQRTANDCAVTVPSRTTYKMDRLLETHNPQRLNHEKTESEWTNYYIRGWISHQNLPAKIQHQMTSLVHFYWMFKKDLTSIILKLSKNWRRGNTTTLILQDQN